MSKQAIGQEEFLKLNPFCCFCGGVNLATTRDHVPPKIAFTNKAWPEGFEFPACEKCNSSTKLLDQEFALLCAYGGFGKDVAPTNLDHFRKVFTGVMNNNRSLAIGLSMTSNEKRRAMREWGRTIARGSTYKEQPIIKLPPRAELAHDTLAFKLGCALHYKHFGRPLSGTSKVVTSIETNASLLGEDAALHFLKHTLPAPSPMRGRKNLAEQFAYRFATSNDLRVGAFVCKIGDSFLLNILTFENPKSVKFNLTAFSAVAGYLAEVNCRAKSLETISTHLMFDGPRLW